MSRFHYLDSSAIVKLVIQEAESAALRRYLRPASSRATSRLSWSEVARAVRKTEPSALPTAKRILSRFEAVELSPDVVAAAGDVDPLEVRTLDAVHIASAAKLVPDLIALISYDKRMTSAAVASGIPVASPR